MESGKNHLKNRSSVVKKKKKKIGDKKSSASIHVNVKLSMFKATISGILLKSIADMKRLSTYQPTDHSIVDKNRFSSSKIEIFKRSFVL